MPNKSALDLSQFYPEQLQIDEMDQDEHSIYIKMHTATKECKCSRCGTISNHKHATYKRTLQDLPTLGKQTVLTVNSYEYQCDNPECACTTFVENLDGFLDYYSRMTDRCADFICTLAIETSCEGCARICKNMNMKISGDTVIRLLMKRYKQQGEPECGDTIGIDDFAFKKRNCYGTIIVDAETHKPVAILDGNDGTALKEWLKRNQHIKAVTRDRASVYSSAIQAILPDVMQIADRFHLHQNLLDTIKEILNGAIPADIKIPINEDETDNSLKEPGKKNLCNCG